LKIEILTEKDNPLMNRREVEFSVDHPLAGTPRLIDTKDSLAKKLKIDQDKVFIIKMETQPGVNKTLGEAEVYTKLEKANEIVPNHIKLRNNPEEETKTKKGQEEKKQPEKAKEEQTPESEEEKAQSEKKEEK